MLKKNHGFMMLDMLIWLSLSAIIITLISSSTGRMLHLVNQSTQYASEQSLLISFNTAIIADIAENTEAIIAADNVLSINGAKYRKQKEQIVRIKDGRIIKFGPGKILTEIVLINEEKYLNITVIKKHLKLKKSYLLWG